MNDNFWIACWFGACLTNDLSQIFLFSILKEPVQRLLGWLTIWKIPPPEKSKMTFVLRL